MLELKTILCENTKINFFFYNYIIIIIVLKTAQLKKDSNVNKNKVVDNKQQVKKQKGIKLDAANKNTSKNFKL